jgi:hypothetical protein
VPHRTTYRALLPVGSAGAQLIATFTPDGSHKLSDLTAGSITIEVEYFVLE